ncbi:DUF1800 domain-containing protein [Ascidiimonas aurantiaca]|uniref:DUF1800 domain-containing protein n=1 Tax=Ascidiimonas aurantiaca TaxID=1685432 RepID=UPI0030EE0B77
MELFVNCNTASLDPYIPSSENPWNEAKVHHLYRRIGFSASVSKINEGLGKTPANLVDELIDEAINMAPTPAPEWGTWSLTDYPEDNDLRNEMVNLQKESWALTYTQNMLSNNLRDRLSFFWSNHFVTELNIYDAPSYLYGYIHNLQVHAIGNFKTFVSEVGLTSAMLRYLDGNRNRRNRPNENYARELFELFTLGEGIGYTEEDIVETSKALTGYVQSVIEDDRWSGYLFDEAQFDPGPKTIFGRTGNWGYNDVIDILFEERANEIAHFICSKLYKFFVHPEPQEPIINAMATTFIDANWELAPVLRQLFKSEHFFHDESIGVIIKSPFDVALNFINETSLGYDDELMEGMIYFCSLIGQRLFDPVDVAGWQRNRNWINANALIGRWSILEWYLFSNWDRDQEQFRTFGVSLAGTSSDPYYVARVIIDTLVPKGLLTEDDYKIAGDVFKSDVPDNYYDDGSWNLYWDSGPYQVFLLLQHISKEPEFQLK